MQPPKTQYQLYGGFQYWPDRAEQLVHRFRVRKKKYIKESAIQCGVHSRSPLPSRPQKKKKLRHLFIRTRLKSCDCHNRPFPWITSGDTEPPCRELFLPERCADKQLPFASPVNKVACNRRFQSRCASGICWASGAMASILLKTKKREALSLKKRKKKKKVETASVIFKNSAAAAAADLRTDLK